MDSPLSGNLVVLPIDIIVEITGKFLDVNDICRLSGVNSFYRDLLRSDDVWRYLFRRYFPLDVVPDAVWSLLLRKSSLVVRSSGATGSFFDGTISI